MRETISMVRWNDTNDYYKFEYPNKITVHWAQLHLNTSKEAKYKISKVRSTYAHKDNVVSLEMHRVAGVCGDDSPHTQRTGSYSYLDQNKEVKHSERNMHKYSVMRNIGNKNA